MKTKSVPQLMINVDDYPTDQELYGAIGASLCSFKMFKEYRKSFSEDKTRPGPEGFAEKWFANNISPRDKDFEKQIWEFFLQILTSCQKK